MSFPRYHKIAIWGSVAMGKTTLARYLGSKLKIKNIIFTDDIILADDLSKIDNPQILSDFTKLLNRSTWIIDGNLDELIPRIKIMEEADLVVIFNIPFYSSLKRMLTRDVKAIFNIRKHREFQNLGKSMSFITKSIILLFESVFIINKYKRFFFFNLISIAIANNLGKKVVIIGSNADLDKFHKKFV